MKDFLLRIFTWWNGATLGTLRTTRLYGELVGEDQYGNKYYRTRNGRKDPALGIERRWVIYNGYTEASAVPPGWNAWLRHTTDVAPSKEEYIPKEWEMPHLPNMTGTSAAYRPQGATLATGRRSPATGDYEAWSPDN